MKKIIFAALLASGSLWADWVGQAGLGYSRGDEGADYVTAFAGANVFMGAGLRLEYTKNFSENAAFTKEDITRYGIFATYQFGLIPSIAITPKIGLSKTDGEFKTVEVIKAVSKSSTEFTYGLELDYYFSDLVSMYVGYTDYGKVLKIEDIDTSKMDRANFALGLKVHL